MFTEGGGTRDSCVGKGVGIVWVQVGGIQRLGKVGLQGEYSWRCPLVGEGWVVDAVCCVVSGMWLE